MPIYPPNRCLQALVEKLSPQEEKSTVINLVEKCLKGLAPSYFTKYFQSKGHDIHDYNIRNKDRLVIDKVKLESTKRAFFYKGADIFNNYL